MLRKYVVTLQPLWWRKYFWKARFIRKVFRKNLSKRFGSCRKTPYLCTRFDEDNTSRMRKFLRRFRWWKKSSKRFGSYQKTSYLCTRFDEDNTSRTRKFLGRFDDEKIFQKDLEIWKTRLTFAPLSHSSERGCDRDEIPNKIGIKFFEDFEQLRKFYPLSQESDFKQYLWD